MSEMKEYIQQLIGAGKTKEALEILAKNHSEAIVLSGNYVRAERDYNQGILDFSEWSRVVARTNNALLELSKNLSGPAPAEGYIQPAYNPPPMSERLTADPFSASSAKKKTVFISYNHADQAVAMEVHDLLEQNGCDALLDKYDMVGGQSIMTFIQNCIKKADIVVSIVSAKSLESGWVGEESVASMYAVWLADKKFIPLRLDSVVFDSKFQISTLRRLNDKISELDRDIKEIQELGSDARNLEEDRKRLFDLKTGFGAILQRFTSVLIIDLQTAGVSGASEAILKAVNQ
jgi:TIR domain/Effector-associated domain 11